MLLDVCGASVPEVDVDVDVDVEVAAVVEVVDEELEDGLLEQAASARAQAGSTSRAIERARKAWDIRRV